MNASALTEFFEDATEVVTATSDFLYGSILAYLLLGVGLVYTLWTRGVQVRLFGRMWKSVAGKDDDTVHPGISSFQAFATGMASRVGTGNIVGVAVALTLGGPGAIFWMWVVAFLGMATGFVEATLAQMFKVRNGSDDTYRGGPAYYIRYGLKSKAFAAVFAVIVVFVFGFAFNMVQANTIADTLSSNHNISSSITAIVLVALVAPLLFGGIKVIAKFSGRIMPIVAGIYVLIALTVVAMNITQVPQLFGDIFSAAFGLNEAVVGAGAGIMAALINGTRRGLFSNEAGMGSAPNMAATASVSHPIQQGLIQSLGVFIDTMVVCTATALMVMASGVYDVSLIGSGQGAALTGAAVISAFGGWAAWLMTGIIFLFAFTSIFGNYTYAEVNLHYLGARKTGLTLARLLIVVAVAAGALVSLDLAWALADVAMWAMAMINLVAILLLSKWFIGALKDYEALTKGGKKVTRFVGHGNPHLPGDLPGDIWAKGATR
ncbi:alanine/glycine:cation symporter family protein [Jonesia quinghaiensis]|uniref:alanine/glycine:cation symporter family protein n=1 Tax=Jonesia quinghaiensis TaxID=262806 RepID=UPI0003FCFFAE|nr:alanine/glycine:cation symporter family protein [Jonesia quinghaiensis]